MAAPTSNVPVPVFVFGTLKRGFPNFHRNPGRLLEGDFQTVERYPLYLVGQRRSPWLVDRPGEGYNVSGEVYKVDPPGLDQLDLLERIAEADGYRRQVIQVTQPGSVPITVQVYLKPPESLEQNEIFSGPHGVFSLAQAAQYRPRS